MNFSLGSASRSDLVRVLDSYATLLVLLLPNFMLLELVDDPRWAAIGSTLLAAAALVVAIVSFVALTTLGFGDLSPDVGLPHRR